MHNMRVLTRVAANVCVRAQFEQINEAFDLLHAGKCLRVVLAM